MIRKPEGGTREKISEAGFQTSQRFGLRSERSAAQNKRDWMLAVLGLSRLPIAHRLPGLQATMERMEWRRVSRLGI